MKNMLTTVPGVILRDMLVWTRKHDFMTLSPHEHGAIRCFCLKEREKGGTNMKDIIEQITDALDKIYQDELESYLEEQKQKARLN